VTGLLAASLIDGAMVLALALAASASMRRRSAAARHAVLATAIVTASLMPALELVMPQVPVLRWGRSAALSSGPSRRASSALVSSKGLFPVETASAMVSLSQNEDLKGSADSRKQGPLQQVRRRQNHAVVKIIRRTTATSGVAIRACKAGWAVPSGTRAIGRP